MGQQMSTRFANPDAQKPSDHNKSELPASLWLAQGCVQPQVATAQWPVVRYSATDIALCAGQLVVRPFLDGQHVVRLAVETCSISPIDNDAPAVPAEADGTSGPQSPPHPPSSSVQPDGAGAPPSEEAALKTFLVSKTSEPSIVARAIAWEISNRGDAAMTAGRPVALIRMGPGGAAVQAAAAVALVQGRLMNGGMRVAALPRQVVVQEAERTFTVVEWALVPVPYNSGSASGTGNSSDATN